MRFTPLALALATLGAASSLAAANDRVLIVPFTTFTSGSTQQWIGKGVQENLTADLGRNGLDAVAFNGEVIVEDNATAARITRGLNAPYTIRGNAQVIGENVRLTAQLIDSKTGDTLRTGLVTGSAADLLKLEDDLANQLKGVPTASPAPAAATAAPAPAATPLIMPQVQPQVIVISQPPDYYPSYADYYPNYYSYGYNGFNYPFYPVLFYQVNTGRGHPHDHDGHEGHDGHDGHGGGHDGHGGGPGQGPGRGGHSSTQIVNGFNPVSLPLPTSSMSPVPTVSFSPVPTVSFSPVPSVSFSPTPTVSFSPTPTRNFSPTPTVNFSPTPTRSFLPTPTASMSPTPTRSVAPLPTNNVPVRMPSFAPPAPSVQRISSPAPAPRPMTPSAGMIRSSRGR